MKHYRKIILYEFAAYLRRGIPIEGSLKSAEQQRTIFGEPDKMAKSDHPMRSITVKYLRGIIHYPVGIPVKFTVADALPGQLKKSERLFVDRQAYCPTEWFRSATKPIMPVLEKH